MRMWLYLAGLSLAFSASAIEAKKYDNKVYIFKVEDDKFSKSLSYVGLSEMINPFGGTTRRWMLRTWIQKDTKVVTHQLYVVVSYYNQWRFYQSAADDTATSLPFTTIDRTLEGCQGLCSFSETMGMTVTDEFIRQKALTGFQVKISAKSGDELIIDVTPAQIQSQLLTDNQFLPEAMRWTVPAATTNAPPPR